MRSKHSRAPKRQARAARRGDAHATRRRFEAPYGARDGGEPPHPCRRPLLPDIETLAGRQWGWTDHALQRLEERGIGVYEVLSAVYAPDWTHDTSTGEVRAVRGDVQVIYDPVTFNIVSVQDRNEDRRTTPREPLHPMVVRHVPPTPPTPPQPETETPAMSKPTSAPTGTAQQFVWAYLAGKKRGDAFRVLDVVRAGERAGHSASAIRQAIRVHVVDTGEARHVGHARSGEYRLTTDVETFQGAARATRAMASAPVAPPAPRPAPPGRANQAAPAPAAVSAAPSSTPVDAADTGSSPLSIQSAVGRPAVGAASAAADAPRKLGKTTTAVFAFAEPPADPVSEVDESIAHLRAHVVALKENPDRWAQVFVLQGTSQVAGKRVTYLRNKLDNPDVEIKLSKLEQPNTFGVYARYRG